MKRVLVVIIALSLFLVLGCSSPVVEEDPVPDTIEGTIEKLFDDRVVEITINDHFEKESKKIVLVDLRARSGPTARSTINGAHSDAIKLMQGVFSFEEVIEVTSFWETVLVDQYGQEKVDNIVKVSFDRETADKIKWENIKSDNIPNIATDYWKHGSF